MKALLLFLPTLALAQVPPLPQVTAPKADTNLYYLPFAWGTVTNADSYAVRVYSNSTFLREVPSVTNYLQVSNLSSTLDAFEFRAVAINSAGVSDESNAAGLRLSTLYTSDDLATWFKAPGVDYDPATNASRFLRLSNWTYREFLHRQ